MASAIAQLIAQQRGTDILGATGRASQTAGAIQQLQSIPIQQELQRQQLTIGQRQLAQADAATAEKTRQQGLAIMANTALELKKVPPEQRAQVYQQIRSQVEKTWPGAHPWPAEYNEQVQGMLDFADAQVNGATRFETDEAIRKEQAKPTGPASSVGKLMADRKAAEAAGASPQELKAYDDAITKARTVSSNSEVPAGIKEYEYFKSLSPEDQKIWLNNKRGDRVSTEVEKNIFKASDDAQAESVKHENYMELARQYEQSAGKMSSGVVGSFSEWIKEQTGNQDQVSLLRKDWAAVKASEVVKNLPPGAASDADVALALAGFLPTNAKPEMVASFLRGIAKLSKINGEYQSFKANYLAENKSPSGMLKAWREYSKDNVPTGSTLSSANNSPAAPTFKDGQTATNPQTGEKMIFKEGQWQKM